MLHWANRMLHWANRMLHWANRMLHYANRMLHWANRMLHYANRMLHWANRMLHWAKRTLFWANCTLYPPSADTHNNYLSQWTPLTLDGSDSNESEDLLILAVTFDAISWHLRSIFALFPWLQLRDLVSWESNGKYYKIDRSFWDLFWFFTGRS